MKQSDNVVPILMSNFPNVGYAITSTNNTGTSTNNTGSFGSAGGGIIVGTIPTHNEQTIPTTFQKIPNLIFKLFTAENGHILEVTNKILDPASLYMGAKFDNSSKVYILNSSENLGDKIAQILSVYLLEK